MPWCGRGSRRDLCLVLETQPVARRERIVGGIRVSIEKDAAGKEGEVPYHSRGASPAEGNLGSDRVRPTSIPPKPHLSGADKREAASHPDKKRALASPRQSKFDHGTSSSSLP